MNREDALQILEEEIKYMQDDGQEITDSKVEDVIPELAEQQVDLYNYNLIQWLAEDFHRGFAVNEYVNDGMADMKDFDIFKVLMGAQYLENEQVLNDVWAEIREEYIKD